MESEKYHDVKITVLKKLKLEDIHKEYAKSDVPLACIDEEEGDEYISSNCERPDKFCIVAWEGLNNKVSFLAKGGNSPHTKQGEIAIHSCNDGLHPVIFRLERIKL